VLETRATTHADLARLGEGPWDVLGLLDGAADELLEERDLDGLGERVRER
jgi:hypothetical protein